MHMKKIRFLSVALAVFGMCAMPAMAQETFDLSYAGDLAGLLPKLRQIDPQMSISSGGLSQPIPVGLRMVGASKLDILRAVGELAGEKADLIYSPNSNALRISYKALPATPVAPVEPVVRNADGSVQVAFGRARAQLTCTALDVCAIELEAGERVNRLDVGDSARWEVSPSMVGEGAQRAIVLIVRPTQTSLATRLIVSTNKRIYSIALASTPDLTAQGDSRLYFTYQTQAKG